jgi:flagellar basal body-associated protein FliL
MKLILLIILIVVALLGFGIVTLIFVRVLVPAIARLKSSLLIEEKEDAKEQSLPAPPTSERNQLPIEPARTDENLER